MPTTTGAQLVVRCPCCNVCLPCATARPAYPERGKDTITMKVGRGAVWICERCGSYERLGRVSTEELRDAIGGHAPTNAYEARADPRDEPEPPVEG